MDDGTQAALEPLPLAFPFLMDYKPPRAACEAQDVLSSQRHLGGLSGGWHIHKNDREGEDATSQIGILVIIP